ncbi:hypothetical protein ACHAWT_009094 [Skeletonema menzelii]
MELSPKSMAQAAYEDAVAKMSNDLYSDNEGGGGHHGRGGNVEKSDRGESAESVNVREETFLNTALTRNSVNVQHDEKAMSSRIEDIWRSSGGTVETKITETMETILAEIDGLVGLGLGAFSALDTTKRQLNQSKELAENRDREAKRLHSIDEQSRTTLSNLLRVVESSKEEARDSSRSAQVEARLRQNVNTLRDERDKAISENATNRRKLSLQEEELRLTKSKLSRVQQEKISIERDSRVAISLARSLDNSNSNDASYYKRKVTELSDKLQQAHEELRQLRGKKQRNSY